ncbi:MAG: ABC transporter ATP-binding protein [Candidatus Lokiarchaeota archaeon]|nr:ABC transporter ATP-binding protein [Candidatus Harpocratesius repetitus]
MSKISTVPQETEEFSLIEDGSLDNNSILLELRQVSKKYGDFPALNSINLKLRKGEVFGYIGPNGAGKTTTIKIIVGLIRNFEGTIIFNGKSLSKSEDSIHQFLGYLPQDVGFQSWRTVNHLLETFGKLSGVAKTELSARIDSVLEMVGLKEVKYKKIIHLSGGMQQKLRLAQALLHNPPFLVMDEPMTGLDPSSRYQMKKIIRKLAEQGITIFLSSHILSEVQDIADRIGILNRGRILNVGTPQELQKRFMVDHQIEILLEESDKTQPSFSEIPMVTKIEKKRSYHYVISISNTADLDSAISQILQMLVNQKSAVRKVELKQPSLEEVYLKYVEEDK